MFNSVHHIAIIVSDLKTAKEFYCGKLGFEIVRENIRNEKNDIKLDLKINENTELEIFVKKDAPERPSPEAMGLRHLAFKVDNIYDVVKYLEGRGIKCEEVRNDTYTGKALTFFKDPDGLPIEIHE